MQKNKLQKNKSKKKVDFLESLDGERSYYDSSFDDNGKSRELDLVKKSACSFVKRILQDSKKKYDVIKAIGNCTKPEGVYYIINSQFQKYEIPDVLERDLKSEMFQKPTTASLRLIEAERLDQKMDRKKLLIKILKECKTDTGKLLEFAEKIKEVSHYHSYHFSDNNLDTDRELYLSSIKSAFSKFFPEIDFKGSEKQLYYLEKEIWDTVYLDYFIKKDQLREDQLKEGIDNFPDTLLLDFITIRLKKVYNTDEGVELLTALKQMIDKEITGRGLKKNLDPIEGFVDLMLHAKILTEYECYCIKSLSDEEQNTLIKYTQSEIENCLFEYKISESFIKNWISHTKQGLKEMENDVETLVVDEFTECMARLVKDLQKDSNNNGEGFLKSLIKKNPIKEIKSNLAKNNPDTIEETFKDLLRYGYVEKDACDILLKLSPENQKKVIQHVKDEIKNNVLPENNKGNFR